MSSTSPGNLISKYMLLTGTIVANAHEWPCTMLASVTQWTYPDFQHSLAVNNTVEHLIFLLGVSVHLSKDHILTVQDWNWQVLDDMQVRAGLEEPHLGTYQRRMGHIVLLGDMYNYKLVDSR